MGNKVQDYIDQKIKESQKGLGSAAFMNTPAPGQIALEGQITTGNDVRVQETMRNSQYDPQKDGSIDAASVGGNTAADLLDRTNHTGTQAASSISDFATEVESLLLWKYVSKLSNETKNSNTTLANDGALVLPLVSGNVYRVKFHVLINVGNATMDYKFALNYSGTLTAAYCKGKWIAPGDMMETLAAQSSLIGSTAVTSLTGSGLAYVELDCVLDVATSGNLGFQWAQNTSDAGNLTVLKGSYLEHAIMNLPL